MYLSTIFQFAWKEWKTLNYNEMSRCTDWLVQRWTKKHLNNQQVFLNKTQLNSITVSITNNLWQLSHSLKTQN